MVNRLYGYTLSACLFFLAGTLSIAIVFSLLG